LVGVVTGTLCYFHHTYFFYCTGPPYYPGLFPLASAVPAGQASSARSLVLAVSEHVAEKHSRNNGKSHCKEASTKSEQLAAGPRHWNIW